MHDVLAHAELGVERHRRRVALIGLDVDDPRPERFLHSGLLRAVLASGMKFAELKSVAHNIADSLASGIGMMIGVYEMDVFREAAASKEGFIEVDFLAGAISGGKASRLLARAARLYAEALPRLCERHGVSVSDFRALKARFSGTRMSESFLVTVEDRNGRRSQDEYFGVPGKRARVLDPLGRVRTKRSGS